MKAGIFLVLLVCLFVSCNKLKDYFPNPHPNPHPLPQFNKLYGGTRFEEPAAIIGTKDGGYLMAARTLSMDGDVTGFHGTMDAWVVKLNSEGNIMWQRALGGSNDDLANAVTTCLDGGYIMAGYTFSNDGDVSGNHGGVTPLDAWVVRMDKDGTILWQKTLGGTGTDIAAAIYATKDSGFIMAGTTDSNDGDVSGHHGDYDYWIVKLDKDGNKLWQKTLGGTRPDLAASIIAAKDGGYIVIGGSESNDGDVSGNHGYFDAWVVKLDEVGNLAWQKSIGGSALDAVFSIIATTDGGYLMTGDTNKSNPDVNSHDGTDAWVVKLNKEGNVLWQKAFGGSAGDVTYSIVEGPHHHYMIAGGSESNDGDVSGNHGGYDAWVVQLDDKGNKVWQKSFGGTNVDQASSLIARTDGSYVLAGTTYSNDGDVGGNHGDGDVWAFTIKDK